MANNKRINQLRKSITLQTRIKANLESMSIADAGKTVELVDQILATLNAQLAIYCAECGDKKAEIADLGFHNACHSYMETVIA